jgi:hypothetical protein
MTFGLGVERRGRLVENQDRRVLEQRAGNRQALALAAREQHAVLADLGVEALRQAVDELARVGGFGGFSIVARAGASARLAVGDVAGDRVVEQRDLLGDQRDVPWRRLRRV